jgi:acyl carrier protein
MGMNASDRFLSIYNFSYGNGVVAPLKAWLMGGVLFPFDLNKKGLSELIDLIRHEKLTVYHTPPSVFRNFINAVNPGSLPSLRWIHLGGELVVARDIEMFKEKFLPGCRIFNNLGSSEMASILRYIMTHDTEIEDGVVPVGYPTERVHLKIVDENGNQVDNGQVGELVVRSRYLSAGYWSDPKMTAEKFIPVEGSKEKIFYTGDLVYQRPDGCFIYSGRKDSQVKVRGSRVVVAELEAAISRITGVSQAAVRVDHAKGSSARLIAYVIPEEGSGLTPGEIRTSLASRLPLHMVPHQVILLAEFPKTSSGKVARRSLPIPDMERPALPDAPEAPATTTEETLAAIWGEIFQMDGIGVTDNFFDLGGDSLQAVELFVEIEKAFSRRFPISLLIQASNIRQQAVLVEKIQEQDPWLPLVEFNPDGDRLPLFCFAGKGGNPIKFRQLAMSLGADQPVYFLQSRGLSGQDRPLKRVEDIAADYLQAIRLVQRKGPYRLLGSSFGGKVAYEAAYQLDRDGEKVDFVMMLDTFATGYPI